MHEEERDIYFGIINRFIGFYTRQAQRRTANDTSREYPFVPMDTRQAFDQILCARSHLEQRADRPSPWTFLDIGAGIGNVLLIAEQMGFDVFGIEKDPYPCSIARQLIGEDRVQEADIWQFDGYHRFDVIYYFRPFHDGTLERRFETMIEDRVRPGGILIANRKMSNAIESDTRFVRLHPTMPVWGKRTAATQAMGSG